MINVTKTFLPPIEEYQVYLDKIWKKEWITNNGECVVALENKLKDFLQVKHFFFVSNGTVAIQIAIKALDLQGEIITTPFSYVATTSSIVWENCTPVFADIDPQSLCIDPAQVEKKINEKTSAILATHVFGNPCAVEPLMKIGQKYGIKIIYDAAHAFGVKLNDTNILQWGDVSTLSFHATKVFHTVEGGAIVTNDNETARRIQYMRNFGHNGPEQFWGVGINGKNSEFHAAMGLANFDHFDRIVANRAEIFALYDQYLAETKVFKPTQPDGLVYNYAYYPVVFESESLMLEVRDALNANDIFPRRYFYPSLSELPYVENLGDAPVSGDISKRILCLPLYFGLETTVVKKICGIIIEILRK